MSSPKAPAPPPGNPYMLNRAYAGAGQSGGIGGVSGAGGTAGWSGAGGYSPMMSYPGGAGAYTGPSAGQFFGPVGSAIGSIGSAAGGFLGGVGNAFGNVFGSGGALPFQTKGSELWS